MFRKLATIVVIALLLSMAHSAMAGQLGWWALDDGAGTTARDNSGKGHNGTLNGGATWANGKYGRAVNLDGVDDFVEIPHSPDLCVTEEATVSAWFNTPRTDGPDASGYQGIVAKGNSPRSYSLYTTAAGAFHFSTGPSGAFIGSTSSAQVPVNEWAHVLVKVEGGQHKYFLNGEPAGVGGADVVLPGTGDTSPVYIGRTAEGARFFEGLIDDVRIYDLALTDEQIVELYNGNPPVWPKAIKPDPEDGAAAVASPLLQWIAGDGAMFHDVYFGTSPELTEADLVAPRQMFTMYWHIAGVEPGATYYWRVDEITAEGEVATGDVWSFVAQAVTAYYPEPADGAAAVSPTTTLTWMPGRSAVAHQLYLSDDADAVTQGTAEADKGELTEATYTPEDLLGATTYYWRVDEIGAGDALETGAVWSFTTFMLVDDFESYTDEEGSRIYESWIDGWTNNTGSIVGYLDAPFAEQTIVHGGGQSMPLDYNNTISPFYSEAELTFASPRDWTVNGVTDLNLWFQGAPVSFVETAPDAFAMSAAGADVWGSVDEFRYAYKRLNGDGSIVARIESVDNTNDWAKVGVMIRETLDTSSTHAFMALTPNGRRAFQNRPVTNGASSSAHSGTGAITLPYWVKIERTGNELTASHSADGVTWTIQPDDENTGTDRSPNPQLIGMTGSVYIGLALTSHSAGVGCTAEFSGVATTGNVTGEWQVADVGVAQPGNSPDTLYVALADSAGKTAVAANPDPDAVLKTDWTPWKIPLSDFAGVNLARVETIYIGVGDRDNPTPNGSGMLYIDDIQVLRPE